MQIILGLWKVMIWYLSYILQKIRDTVNMSPAYICEIPIKTVSSKLFYFHDSLKFAFLNIQIRMFFPVKHRAVSFIFSCMTLCLITKLRNLMFFPNRYKVNSVVGHVDILGWKFKSNWNYAIQCKFICSKTLIYCHHFFSQTLTL